MNLISAVLIKVDYNNKKRKHINEKSKIFDDYGYRMYRLLEYNENYLARDDFGFREIMPNIIKALV